MKRYIYTKGKDGGMHITLMTLVINAKLRCINFLTMRCAQ